MTVGEALIAHVATEAERITRQLSSDSKVGPYIDANLSSPKPFVGSGAIKLVLLGQDPTVKSAEQRKKIKTVLNLDKRGSLRSFVEDLVEHLGLSLDNVYATNVCKNFFTDKPTVILKQKRFDVLQAAGPGWLPLLKQELETFPDACVISLGQPVLVVLVGASGSKLMADHWGYRRKWRRGPVGSMTPIALEHSMVGRQIYPYPHQPSWGGPRSEFYKERKSEFLEMVRRELSGCNGRGEQA